MKWADKIPAQTRDLAWRIIDGEAVIVSLADQKGHSEELCLLNETATRIWELIDGKSTIEAIVKQVAEEYDVDAQTMQSQVGRFLITLAKSELIDFKAGLFTEKRLRERRSYEKKEKMD